MKKAILFVLIALTLFTKAFATSRNSADALVLANSFHQKNQKGTVKLMSVESSALKLVYSCTDGVATRSAGENAYYYVFNVGNDNGFIIVSGDDRAKDVLGYSDNGTFDINSLPTSFSSWLSFYKDEMKYLMSQQESASTYSASTTVGTRSVYASSVSPLLGNIKWNQSSPYNNLCPLINTTTRAATGCVATAMSQVMRYYKYPAKGTGSNAYTTKTLNQQLSVDFSATTYDWDNMTETYGSLSTAAQQNAVATLLYHAGVAVSMDYGESSAASSINMGIALINNFNYDANIQHYLRDFYTIAEWVDMIKTELNAKRPVLYSGQSSGGGHQFVCDGYDGNGLFHFNWGWSGMSDGYFELSALNPGSLGIGGGNSGGFNSGQNIVTGIQKPGGLSTASYQLYLDTSLSPSSPSVSRTTPFNVSMTFWNMGVNSFAGSLGLALYNSNNEFVELIKSSTTSPLANSRGYINPNYSQNISIPSDVAAGTYKLYSVFKVSGQSNWQIMRGRTGTPNYLNVAVSSLDVTISTPDAYPRLTLNSMTCTGNLYNSKTGRFTMNITNTGAEYNSNIVLKLNSATNPLITQTVCTDPVTIATGETKNIEISESISLDAGQYALTAYYDPNNNRSASSISYTAFPNPVTVSVLPKPTASPVFTVTSKISFPDANKVSAIDAILTTKIKNTGGYFNDEVMAFVFPPAGGNWKAYFGKQKIILDTNEEQTVIFSGCIALAPGSYSISVFYWDEASYKWLQLPSSNNSLNFTLVNDATGIEQTTLSKLALYPNPATDVLFLQSDETVKCIRVFDISGHLLYSGNPMISGEISVPVSGLSSGTYILQSETESGVKMNKFIKK
jgi:hypothetical protein